MTPTPSQREAELEAIAEDIDRAGGEIALARTFLRFAEQEPRTHLEMRMCDAVEACVDAIDALSRAVASLREQKEPQG